MKVKPKKIGRPKNKVPSEPVCLRLPRPIARWLRKEDSKQKVVKLAEKELNKLNGGD